MKMSSLDRVEGLSVFGDGPAPGMARRGPWNSAGRGRGRPGRSGARWILSRRRGGAVGGIRSGMGTFGRAVALGARGAAGLEDEVTGRRLRGEDHALMQDDEAAIEELAQLDATAGVGAMVRTGGQLDPAGPEVDGVVAGHLARVAAAEDERELARGGTPGGRRVARGRVKRGFRSSRNSGRKALAPSGVVMSRRRSSLTQAILQGAPEAFDAAFGFGRAGGEVADAEVVQDAAEVGGVLGAPQLFGEAPVGVIADEDVDAIAVEGEGPPILGEHLLEAGWHSRAGPRWGGSAGRGRCWWHHRWRRARSWRGPGPRARRRGWRRSGPARPSGPRVSGGAGIAAAGGGASPAAQGAAQPADQFTADAEALDLAQLLGERGSR